ncbi:xanthine dehydrogenase molybdopterin binding subunit [Planktomarina temperata]|nr:xanthine dehydrogenase molybdopterin binding subunit [Planktomarina temperata]MDA8995625.1 xanthine dehydrogenase molybdopterin binding subunit [Planktomarina temperata]MDA9058995.1 xanthine dehydrogenase molybdopterin binding subunit [Planktomarina temperata]MDA9813059.1 xanthine dehydrogenase molybdopterin binding subunit [Planktomarina temperata]MDC0113910.1 xanthine dehydrogenase molybdopterin binding subunit [Planktomarina temperata]
MSAAASLPHDAARQHVSGSARYVDDIPTPQGTLHLAFGLSSCAAGQIRSVDLSAVRACPGVHLVLEAKDLPHANDVSPSAHDEPLLADGQVHYAGQPIFLVVAESHHLARRAAHLAKIEITEEPALLTIEQALAAESRFEDGPRIYTKGTPQSAMQGVIHRLQGQINLGGQEHFYLEGQAALALPGDHEDMVIHSSTQHPTEIQHKVAEALNIAQHAVRVEVRRMGGGFGGKESQGNALAVACALAASFTRRPCKMRYDRDDDFIITGKRHDCRIDYDVGFDDSGRVQALEFTHYFRCGWALDLSLPVADRAMLHADNAYDLPHVKITSHRLKTNTQSATAFRGFGGPQGMVGIERVMDHIAHSLSCDPAEVRRRNYYPEMSSKPAARPSVTPYQMEVTDFILGDMTESLLQRCDYHARKAEVARWNASHALLKRGIAFSPVKFGISFTLTHLNQAGALVQIYTDGSVLINHGGTEMGQGLFQKLTQVAARSLGAQQAVIRASATDTSKVPNTSATAASSGADLNGMAVQAACDTLIGRLKDHVAAQHGVKPEEITFAEGQVTAPGLVLTWQEVIASAYEARISLSATGFYKTPEIAWDRIKGAGRPFLYFAYGAAVTEVVIDTLTGENRILRCDILHDCGASLNPALDIGQIEGGFVQGAGWLTTEELVWDASGQLKTHAPSTYKIPACSDRPEVFNVDLWPGQNAQKTIYRSKAVGEPPFMHGISAFLALSNAVAACGPHYPDLQAPATSEEVFNAMARARGSAS